MMLAPAMNTCMWESPFTQRHLGVLLTLGMSGAPGNGAVGAAVRGSSGGGWVRVGIDGQCSPRHQTHFEPSFL